jgi:hypothetical protein
VSTLTVDTWHTINIWMKNVTDVPNGFSPLTQVPPMKQMKTLILNLKRPKTHVPIGYLTLNIIHHGINFTLYSNILY